MSDKKHYIPNEFGRTWVTSRFEARRGVHLPLSYIDINDGNFHDAIVFSQIMYWHEPNTETGKPRLRRWLNGHLWLVKNHAEWYAECRVNRATIRKCLDRIRDRKLIYYELHGEKGEVAPFIRVNWDVFEMAMRAWINNQALQDTPDTTGQGVCPDVSDPLLPEVKSNTETTPKTTQRKTPVATDVTTDSASNDPDYTNWVNGINTPKPQVTRPKGAKPHPSNADVLLGGSEPEPTDFDLLVLAVQRVLNIHGGGAEVYAKMLRGEKGRGEYNTYRMDEPVTATELQDWATWHDGAKVDEKTGKPLRRPTIPMKLQSSIIEWRNLGKPTSNTPNRPAPIVAEDVPDAHPDNAADLLTLLKGGR